MQQKTRVHYLIPLPLAHLVYRERLFTEFQVWLLLKHWTNGRLKLTPAIRGRLAAELDTSTRTVARAVKRLRQRDWLGYDPNTGLTYVRGFDTVRIIEGMPERVGAWFNIGQIRNLRAFCSACAFSQFIRLQKIRHWRERLEVQTKGRTYQSERLALPKFYPVALSVVQRRFGLSRATIQRDRIEAERAGFLAVRHNLAALPDNNPGAWLTGFPELNGRLFLKYGKWFIRETDEIQTFLTFRRRFRIPVGRDKNETILKGLPKH